MRNDEVRLYASRLSPNAGFTTYAKILSVGPACASGVISDGGYAVRVGLYRAQDNLEIGQVVYAHLWVNQQTVNYNASKAPLPTDYGWALGNVGVFTQSRCWTGKHLHVEVMSNHAWACYNRGYAPNARLEFTNFIGHVGGNYARSVRQPCP
jgi:hypothetical protein